MSNDPLIFAQSPEIVIATNTFDCRIPIRYRDEPLLQFVKIVQTMKSDAYTTEIPIFHKDGTKLAVAKGRQLYLTEDGKTAGVTMRHLPDGTVCEIDRKPAFEIRRKGAAAITGTAELFTFDGAFITWSADEFGGLLSQHPGALKIGGMVIASCTFKGLDVGIQIGPSTLQLSTGIQVGFV